MAKKKNTNRQPSTPEAKKQATVLTIVAIIAALVMILAANPWKTTSGTARQASSQSQSAETQRDGKDGSGKTKKTAKPSGTLTEQARTMFTGDVESIANEARDLLNAPEDSNVDSLSNLLYRHGRTDLAEATELYDAIGQQQDVETIRTLAREWWPKAMQAAVDARRDALSSNLDGAARAADRLDDSSLASTQDCSDLRGAYVTAKQLVDGSSTDYDALTRAQQNLTAAMSGCATNLSQSDMEKVFGEPQGSTQGKDE